MTEYVEFNVEYPQWNNGEVLTPKNVINNLIDRITELEVKSVDLGSEVIRLQGNNQMLYKVNEKYRKVLDTLGLVGEVDD